MERPSEKLILVISLAVLLAPLVMQTLPATIRAVRTAAGLVRVPWAARRTNVLGPWASVAPELLRQVKGRQSIDLVLADADALEAGPFLAGDLAPHPLWCYDGWAAWRARKPERMIRDDRGVNAATPPPKRADLIVLVNMQHDPPAQTITFEAAERLP